MYALSEIQEFLNEQIGSHDLEVGINDDIYTDFGVDGDDFFELIEQFETRFNVDMSNYLWYFHHSEEGFGLGKLLFKSPDNCVTRIAITPKLLLDAANSGKWPLEYPVHTLPSKRFDIVFSQIFSLLLLVLVSFGLISKWF